MISDFLMMGLQAEWKHSIWTYSMGSILIKEWTLSPNGNHFIALGIKGDEIAFHLSKSFPQDRLISV